LVWDVHPARGHCISLYGVDIDIEVNGGSPSNPTYTSPNQESWIYHLTPLPNINNTSLLSSPLFSLSLPNPTPSAALA
jgi:hypothetical protein